MFNMFASCVIKSFKAQVLKVDVTKSGARRQGVVFTNLFPYGRWTPALCGMLPLRWLQEAPEGKVTHL